MKAVILASGLGTRLVDETAVKAMPMVEACGRPVFWRIFELYSHDAINNLVVWLGLKGHVIKEYFANYLLHVPDVTFDLAENRMEVCHRRGEPWRATFVHTGEHTQTEGRLRRVREHVGDERFCFTCGAGHALFDGAAVARELKALLQRMWRRALDGESRALAAAEGGCGDVQYPGRTLPHRTVPVGSWPAALMVQKR